MKNLIFSITIIFSLTAVFYPSLTISNTGGSPGGKTGSPTDGQQTCQGCHYAGIGTGGTITTYSGYKVPSNYDSMIAWRFKKSRAMVSLTYAL